MWKHREANEARIRAANAVLLVDGQCAPSRTEDNPHRKRQRLEKRCVRTSAQRFQCTADNKWIKYYIKYNKVKKTLRTCETPILKTNGKNTCDKSWNTTLRSKSWVCLNLSDLNRWRLSHHFLKVWPNISFQWQDISFFSSLRPSQVEAKIQIKKPEAIDAMDAADAWCSNVLLFRFNVLLADREAKLVESHHLVWCCLRLVWPPDTD